MSTYGGESAVSHVILVSVYQSSSEALTRKASFTVRYLPAQKDLACEPLHSVVLFRYVRMLGALYMRLTGTAIDCYKYLEPLYNDYRKIKSQNRNGGKKSDVLRVKQCGVDSPL